MQINSRDEILCIHIVFTKYYIYTEAFHSQNFDETYYIKVYQTGSMQPTVVIIVTKILNLKYPALPCPLNLAGSQMLFQNCVTV